MSGKIMKHPEYGDLGRCDICGTYYEADQFKIVTDNNGDWQVCEGCRKGGAKKHDLVIEINDKWFRNKCDIWLGHSPSESEVRDILAFMTRYAVKATMTDKFWQECMEWYDE